MLAASDIEHHSQPVHGDAQLVDHLDLERHGSLLPLRSRRHGPDGWSNRVTELRPHALDRFEDQLAGADCSRKVGVDSGEVVRGVGVAREPNPRARQLGVKVEGSFDGPGVAAQEGEFRLAPQAARLVFVQPGGRIPARLA